MSYSHQGIPTQLFQSENNLLQRVNKIKQLGKRKQSACIKSDWDKNPKISKIISLIAHFSDPSLGRGCSQHLIHHSVGVA